MKKFLTAITAFLLIFTFTGCTKQETFKHDTKIYSSAHTYLEITVVNINQFQTAEHLIAPNCLEFEIEINNKTSDNYSGFAIKLSDFNFYFTIPQTIFEMFMYETTPVEKTDYITITPGETKTLYLRIIYSPYYNEEVVIEDDPFILKLCDLRI